MMIKILFLPMMMLLKIMSWCEGQMGSPTHLIPQTVNQRSLGLQHIPLLVSQTGINQSMGEKKEAKSSHMKDF